MSTKLPYFYEAEPEVLTENSKIIQSILTAEELDSDLLLSTIEDRENIIIRLLGDDKALSKSMLQGLLRTNNELTEIVKSLRGDQQGLLVDFLRTRKAVKKYQ